MIDAISVSKDLMAFLDTLSEPKLVLGSDYRIIGSNSQHNKSKKELASKLGLTQRTFYRKLNEIKKRNIESIYSCFYYAFL